MNSPQVTAIAIIGGVVLYFAVKAFEYFQERNAIKSQTPQQQHRPALATGSQREELTCGICQKPLQCGSSLKLPCYHQFHKKCLEFVFKAEMENKRTCPVYGCEKIVDEEFLVRKMPTLYLELKSGSH